MPSLLDIVSIDDNGEKEGNEVCPKTRDGLDQAVEETQCDLVEPLLPRTNDHDHHDREEENNNMLTSQQDHEEAGICYLPLAGDNENDGLHSTRLVQVNDGPDRCYSLEPQRFVILAVFCINNLIGSAAWITFAPIEDAVEAKFGDYDQSSGGTISNQQINWLSMISMAVYGPGTALCAWVIPRCGFRETVVASSIVMAVGCLFRWLSLSSPVFTGRPTGGDWLFSSSAIALRYNLLLIGQGLVALGQTIFMNAPAKIAVCWFQQTTKTIGAINLSSNFGMILGQALSPLIVVEPTGENLDQLLAGQGVAMGLCALFTAFGYRNEEPALPPSAAEAARRVERQQPRERDGVPSSIGSNISKDLLTLCKNPQYIILLTAIGINYGVNSAIITLMEPWVAVSGFSGDKTAGLCGSLLVAGGMIGTAIASVLLDATRNYNQAVRWSFLSVLVAAFGLVATLQPRCPTWLLATAFTITGMTQMPLLTICFDVAAAHTYPVSEELSSAGLQLVGQYLGILLVNGMAALIDTATSKNGDDDQSEAKYGFSAMVNIAYLSILSISTLIACFYNSDDPRANVVLHSTDIPPTSSTQTVRTTDSIHDDTARICGIVNPL